MKKLEYYLLIILILIFAGTVFRAWNTLNINQNVNNNNNNTNNNNNHNNTNNNNNNTNVINNSTSLRVNGIDILDLNGEKLVLRGMLIDHNSRDMINGTFNRANLAEDSYFTEKEVSKLKELNLNTIDIHGITTVRMTYNNGEINEEYFTNMVDKWVKWCKDNGFYCILNVDAFGVHNPQKYGAYRMPYWFYDEYGPKPYNLTYQARIIHDFWDLEVESMDDERETFSEIWRYIANRYKNDSHVMFALYNEPLHHTWQNSTNEKMQYLGENYSIIITDIIDKIRSTGSENIIFVDRPYVYDLVYYDWIKFIQPINRTNIVWEYHVYVSNFHDLEEWKEDIEKFETLFKTKFGKPTYLGEWGMDPPGIIRKLDDWVNKTEQQVSFLDEKNLSWAYTAWGRLFGQENWANKGTDDYLTKNEIEILIEMIFK
jgi:hypothetical protein